MARVAVGLVGVGLAGSAGHAPGIALSAQTVPAQEPLLLETNLADLDSLKTSSVVGAASVSDYTVRVGLSANGSTSLDHDEVRVTADGQFNIFNVKSGANVVTNAPAGQEWSVTNSNGYLRLQKVGDASPLGSYTGPLLVLPINYANRVRLTNVTRGSIQGPLYRGYFEIKLSSAAGKVNITNILDSGRVSRPLEAYLYGVVPVEMPVDYGQEALKAQAVAARCYAASHYDGSKVSVCDSTSCQVYYGFQAERAESTQAVDATAGTVATYNGAVISAQYSACCGGHTESNENVYVTSNPAAYLRGVRCYDDGSWADISAESTAAAFWTGKPSSFCDWSTSLYRYTRAWNRPDLEAIINRYLPDMPSAYRPQAFSSGQLGQLRELQVLERGTSGKIKRLRILNTAGQYWDVISDYYVRYVLRTTLTSGSQYSSNMVFQHTTSGGTLSSITAYCGGWGHGVGMCQRGARGMASRGYSYVDILQHYYTGITLAGATPLPPSAPVPLTPYSGQIVLSSAIVILTWRGSATAYYAELRNTTTGQTWTRDWSADTAWAVGPLAAGVYEWRVQGRNDVGTGSFCTWQRLVSADTIHNIRLPVVFNGSL
ncbi:MAG: SpoIID/LytB domain-containing protein [Chloroflexota bacterium]